MVANANPAATPSQATQIALADLLGRDHSHCNSHHGRRDHCVTEVGIQLKVRASLMSHLHNRFDVVWGIA
jgi:hypothetical protein